MDEQLDICIIRASRAHLDTDWSFPDGEDVLDELPDGMLQDVDPIIAGLTVNGAKRRQWTHCQSELSR